MNTLSFFIVGYVVFGLLFLAYLYRLHRKQQSIRVQIKELRQLLSSKR
jgi:hypothetical protein